MTYQIYALCQGQRECDSSVLLYLADTGHWTHMPYFFWILVPEARGSPILVDTGFLEGGYKARYSLFEDYRRPRDLLAPFGVEPAKVKTVILSHLHWDHFSACRLYPAAEFYLQKKELDFWRGPAGKHHFLTHFLGDMEDADWLEKEGRLHLVEGEAEIADGVSVHLVGGHTPGLQVVRVRTAEGWAVLAVDAAYVFRSFESLIPPGIIIRVDEALDALDTIKELADSPRLIFPGHDIATVNRIAETYPGVRRLA